MPEIYKMNVEDVNDDSIPTPTVEHDRLALIFERQTHLLHKYHPIEARSGLLQCEDIPVPIHSGKGQARLKDFLWRVTEEITEATASIADDGLKLHFIEELSDAFHFLIELLILSGHTAHSLHRVVGEFYYSTPEGPPPDIRELDVIGDRLMVHMIAAKQWKGWQSGQPPHSVQEWAYETIEYLGRAGNTLKQKPWKQTHMLTDEVHYQLRLVQAYLAFLNLCQFGGDLTFEHLYSIYYKKSEVNKFRQRSMY